MNKLSGLAIMSLFQTMLSVDERNWYESDEFRRSLPKDKLDGIDLEKEYDLIKNKKSKLSLSLRQLVVHRYESTTPKEV